MVVIMVHFNIQYNWSDFGYPELSEPHFVGAQVLDLSQILQLTWKSVGGTNPLRAGNFTSGASSTENVAGTPPYGTHIWILRDVEKAWAP